MYEAHIRVKRFLARRIVEATCFHQILDYSLKDCIHCTVRWLCSTVATFTSKYRLVSGQPGVCNCAHLSVVEHSSIQASHHISYAGRGSTTSEHTLTLFMQRVLSTAARRCCR